VAELEGELAKLIQPAAAVVKPAAGGGTANALRTPPKAR